MSIFRRRLLNTTGNVAVMKISKTINNPSQMVIIDEDSQIIFNEVLSKFRRCLCKVTEPNKAKICYLQNDNSNYYFNGVRAFNDTKSTNVMVYFPGFWYKGEEDDNYYIFKLSLNYIGGYNYIKPSLVGAYTNSGLHSYGSTGATTSDDTYINIQSKFAPLNEIGYHLMDYLQLCVTAWMFCIKYRTTIVYDKFITNAVGDYSGKSSNTGNNDDRNTCTFLGLEYYFTTNTNRIEGIIKKGNTIYISDKGNANETNYKRKYTIDINVPLGGMVTKIQFGRNADVFPKALMKDDLNYRYFSSISVITSSLTNENYYCFSRCYDNYKFTGAFTFEEIKTDQKFSTQQRIRIAFDGDIEEITDVDYFKTLTELSV